MGKVQVILDTDIGHDCDDAGAVAVLNGLADHDNVEILAMTCCTSSSWGAPCIEAINTYYGRPDIPVGTYKKPGLLEEDKWSAYNKYIAQHFPNKMGIGENATDALVVLRQILSMHRNVTIVGIGPLANLADLLNSPPDRISSETGAEMISKSVRGLVQMGGRFPVGDGEFNFAMHPAAAKRVVENWPTPIVFLGKEIDGKLAFGEQLMETPRTNPVRMAYQLHTRGLMKGFGLDHIAVYYAVYGQEDDLGEPRLFEESDTGRCIIDEKGNNTWKSDPTGNHSYLIINERHIDFITGILEAVVCQHPKLLRHEKDPIEKEAILEELPIDLEQDEEK